MHVFKSLKCPGNRNSQDFGFWFVFVFYGFWGVFFEFFWLLFPFPEISSVIQASCAHLGMYLCLSPTDSMFSSGYTASAGCHTQPHCGQCARLAHLPPRGIGNDITKKNCPLTQEKSGQNSLKKLSSLQYDTI